MQAHGSPESDSHPEITRHACKYDVLSFFCDLFTARMIFAARIFAALALLAAGLLCSIIFLKFPDVDYEATLLLGGVSIWICILSSLTSFTLSFLNYRSRRDKWWYWPVAGSSVGLLTILAAMYIL